METNLFHKLHGRFQNMSSIQTTSFSCSAVAKRASIRKVMTLLYRIEKSEVYILLYQNYKNNLAFNEILLARWKFK